ncbi:D-glycerate dehydrogenase [Seongchinamella sediminis]|uniref:D-glycerate dehydrogenase n=1 Tax=Seongchinamella sediminis TaxID=2283635 RepID=A0A3L7E1Y1_9GAMM|nr:D-glycerate dehydrogenase [Seongchinamella sediminis]RLQ22271.1 D-glycerate dehydrogenase [Seongchinamella sediminis]
MSTGKPIIVLSRELPPMFTEALAGFAEVRVGGTDPAAEVLEGAAVYLATGVDPVPEQLIQRFPDSLGLIANIATGTDNIDLAAATSRGIAVSNTPVVTEDTADLTFALLLATCRRLSYCERRLRADEWAQGAGHMGLRVHGKTLGIIGLGEIGQAVARRAQGFNMNILYHGPRRKAEAEAALGAEYCAELADLLARADIVSLNCPLTEDNRHLVNSEALAQMKPGAVLINTGRGPLVDEQALVDALAGGQLGGAGLDVFEFEPQVHQDLLSFDNVTLLPHIGSATGECRADMARRALANIQQFLSAGQPGDRCS